MYLQTAMGQCEAVQEDGGENNPKETKNQANTEADDEYVVYIATHPFDFTRRFQILVNSLQDVFRRVAVIRLFGLRLDCECRGADIELLQGVHGRQGHLPDDQGGGQAQSVHRGGVRGQEHQEAAHDVTDGPETCRGGPHAHGVQGLHGRLSVRQDVNGAAGIMS